MTDLPPEPAILRVRNRVRYLKVIAVFKIVKGVLLLEHRIFPACPEQPRALAGRDFGLGR